MFVLQIQNDWFSLARDDCGASFGYGARAVATRRQPS